MTQHTQETGQRFTVVAVDSVWTQTCGQPWLVNALCAGACFDNKAGRNRSRTIEVDDVHAAREKIILARRMEAVVGGTCAGWWSGARSGCLARRRRRPVMECCIQ